MKNSTSKKDFTKEMLPRNRKELFVVILKNRLSTIFNIGFIVLLFSLPLILILILKQYYGGYISGLESLSDEEKYRELFSIENFSNLGIIVGLFVLSIGLSGIYQVIRSLVFQDNLIFKLDFKKGVKTNLKVFSFVLILVGLLNFLFNYLIYLNVDSNTILYQLSMGAIIVVIGLILPVFELLLVESTLYNLPFKHMIKNAVLLGYKKFYIFFPLGLFNIGLGLLLLIPSSIVFYLLIGLCPLVIAPIMIIINTLICDSVFDEYINKDNFKEIYKKGMYIDASN